MSIFESLGNRNHNTGNEVTPQEAMRQLQSDPHSVLKKSGFNIPEGMNDPHTIVNHLLQSGQVSNTRIQMAHRFINNMGRTK